MVQCRRLFGPPKTILMFALVILLQSIHFSYEATCTAIDQCSCRMDDGKEVSLHQIDKRNDIAFKQIPESFWYIDYNPCTTFVEDKNCHDVLACQYSTDGDKDSTYPLADPKTHIFSVDSVTGNVIMQYSAGSPIGGGKRLFNAILQCDMSVTEPVISGAIESPTSTFTLTLTHKCACPGACSSQDPAKDSGKNLSVGSILCILLLVMVLVYAIGGILFLKYYKKNEGIDIVPHHAFWSDLPSKAKDGCKFTWAKIRKKDEDYEEI